MLRAHVIAVVVTGDQIPRLCYGYAGDGVQIEKNGYMLVVPKTAISAEAHKQLNILERQEKEASKCTGSSS